MQQIKHFQRHKLPPIDMWADMCSRTTCRHPEWRIRSPTGLKDWISTETVRLPAGSAALMLLSFLIPVQSPQKLTFCWVSVLITVLGLLNLFGRIPADAHGSASIGEKRGYHLHHFLEAGLPSLEVLLMRNRNAHATMVWNRYAHGTIAWWETGRSTMP